MNWTGSTEMRLREALERMVIAVDAGFGGTALRIPNPGERRAIIAAAIEAEVVLATPSDTDPSETGSCWFCKGRFPVDALIAGYDTFEEQRLACLACNERMSGHWRPDTDPSGLADVLRAIERAEKAVDDLCQGRLRWEMRVPAEPDHDPDLIISEALRLARAAIHESRPGGGLAEAPLDVERLARAMKASEWGCSEASDPALHNDCYPDHGAGEVAAAYAKEAGS